MKKVKLLVVIIAMPMLTSCSLWRASGQHIYNDNAGNVGIGTTNPESKLSVVDDSTIPVPNEVSGLSSTISSPTNARAIYGAAVNTKSTWNYGGYFTAAGESSGVFGEASDPLLGLTGGVFHSYGKNGKGVLGLALNTDTNASNYGGWFEARGPNGVGLYAKGGANGYAAKFNGTIENQSGGIKFPDGTLQTTAGVGLSGLTVVTKSECGRPTGLQKQVHVFCPSGKIAIAGGGSIWPNRTTCGTPAAINEVFLKGSYPLGDPPNGWGVTTGVAPGSPPNMHWEVRANVVCVNAP